MASLRWKKLRADLRATWGRLLVMQLAIALAVAAFGAALGTRAVLQREIRASYLGTHPADATIVLDGPVDAALVEQVRARPGIAEADRRGTVRARVRPAPDAPWQLFVLFVAEDWTAARLSTVVPDRGAWPPPRGALLVERTAPDVMHLHGDHVELDIGDGTPHPLPIAGTVHDAGQAPNWQEHRGVGYATLATLADLGQPAELHELRVTFDPAPATGADVEAAARELASWLRAEGHAVHELRVPNLRRHPHQGLMNGVQLVMLVLSVMLLVLASIVLATMLSGILARQTREIGIMKAIGARTGQLAGMYAVFVAGMGLVALAVAAPLGRMAAHGMIGTVARMMNLALHDASVPGWVLLVQAALALLLPLAFAAAPILRATTITVRAALAHSGARVPASRALARLPVPLRNALRRPVRLAFTMSLLVVAATLVLAAANVLTGLSSISAKLDVARHFDLELKLRAPVPREAVADLAGMSGIRTFEAWQIEPAAVGEIVHTYPDGDHGSFNLVAALPASTLVAYPLREGRWLAPGDRDAVVLGHNAARGVRIGEQLVLGIEGKRSTWTVVGRVEEVGGASAFVTPEAFAQATGTTGVRVLRFATTATTAAERAPIVAALEATLAARGVAVEYALPGKLMQSIIDDHVVMVVRAVLLMAVILALVGFVGLGSTMAISIAERTREIGVLKAIGASGGRVLRILLAEALAIAVASFVLAALLALPLTALVDARIAANGFIADPPFAVSVVGLAGCALAMSAGSAIATLFPARRAARLPVRVALADTSG